MKYNIPISKEQFVEWLDALRSDDFKQGYMSLSRMDDGEQSHCCLGVLCEVMGCEQIIGTNFTTYLHDGKEASETLPFGNGTDFSTVGYLPPYYSWSVEQQQKFGKVFRLGGRTLTLTELNDSGEFAFKEIAEIIESFFEPQQ